MHEREYPPFRELVERLDDRMLVDDGERSLSYAQMDEESGRVYCYLVEHGIGRDCFVHVFMSRKVQFASCMIGVWKAGAALMLTEDTYPVDRVDFMREEVGCDLVLDQALYEHIMRKYEPKEGFEDVDDHDLAYVVYTSGSTGVPKGVLHGYGNLDQASEVVPEPKDYSEVRYALVHPLHFVAAILCFTDAMMAGISVYIVPTAACVHRGPACRRRGMDGWRRANGRHNAAGPFVQTRHRSLAQSTVPATTIMLPTTIPSKQTYCFVLTRSFMST